MPHSLKSRCMSQCLICSTNQVIEMIMPAIGHGNTLWSIAPSNSVANRLPSIWFVTKNDNKSTRQVPVLQMTPHGAGSGLEHTVQFPYELLALACWDPLQKSEAAGVRLPMELRLSPLSHDKGGLSSSLTFILIVVLNFKKPSWWKTLR